VAKPIHGKLQKKRRPKKRTAGKSHGAEIVLQEKTRQLQERVKELDCLYGISRFIERPGISVPQILQGAVKALPSAWQHPEIAAARIVFDTVIVTSRRFRETPWVQSQSIKVRGKVVGRVDVAYLENAPKSHEGPFLQEERNLLDEVAERLGRVIERMKAEEELREREKELALMNQELQEVNTALRVLLRKREEDRAELEDRVAKNIKDRIFPYLKRLKIRGLDEGQKELADILETHLKEFASGFQQNLTNLCLNVTPMELRVADLVRQGRTTKEIADLLHSSPRAVEFHRINLRKKLNLKEKKTNLRSFLLSMK
jgi:DNA-binding CsgD family transcriptional regulator